MLRKFKITIDGKEYLVEMEEIGAPAQAAAPLNQYPLQYLSLLKQAHKWRKRKHHSQ
ncbi:acetyl-CoA carboxylase biotin carboxyl carrier protein subunit domain protein [Streptococcus pyogenes GA41208]|nr:acetyl-CoA carboxylase biotin carboxyl carrier protein subunit domain protein [Streptococcus pyogenes GA41208]